MTAPKDPTKSSISRGPRNHAAQIIDGDLALLEGELGALPPSRRSEIVAEVRNHIVEARQQLENETDADLHNLLDRLGDPAQLAAEATADEKQALATGAPRPGLIEIGALVLTPIIWPVGVILLWTSSAWTTRDKLIGTLVPPGGYPGLFFLMPLLMWVHVGQGCGTDGCSPPTWLFVLLVILAGSLWLLLLALPVLTGIYMAVKLRRRYRLDASTHPSSFQGASG